jgi:hypothetical protein
VQAGSLTLFEEQLVSDDGTYCPAGSLGSRDALGRIVERVERSYQPATAEMVSRHVSLRRPLSLDAILLVALQTLACGSGDSPGLKV